jgi:hypothetical protein
MTTPILTRELTELEEMLIEVSGICADLTIRGYGDPRDAVSRIGAMVPSMLGRLRAARTLLDAP